MEIFPEAVKYLEERKKECLVYIEAFENLFNYRLRGISHMKGDFKRWFWTEWLKLNEGAVIDKYDRELKKIELFLNPPEFKEGQITQEDIERAREYPFEELIKASKGMFAICPFHPEKKPSFYIRKNFGYCFGCAWHGDTISFIMDTEAIGFVEAVKKLTR